MARPDVFTKEQVDLGVDDLAAVIERQGISIFDSHEFAFKVKVSDLDEGGAEGRAKLKTWLKEKRVG